MPSTRDSRKKKKEFPTAHQIKKNHVTAARKGPGMCWCQGVQIGCGQILAYSTRKKHEADEKKNRLRAARNDQAALHAQRAHSPPPSPRNSLMYDNESNNDAFSDNLGANDYEIPPPIDFDMPRDGSPILIDDGHDREADAFRMELLAAALEDVEEDREDAPDERKEEQMQWDQAREWERELEEAAALEDEDGGFVLREVERERRLDLEQLMADNERGGLSPEELTRMRLVAFSLKYGLCREAQEELARWPELNLPSAYRMEKELETLSGLEEDIYHCCINSCVLFTGEFEDCQACPICEEPRLDGRQKPRNVFRYLPLQPRLQALFKSPKMLDKLQYRKNLGPFTDTYRDVFDSEHFRTLLQTKVVMDGTEYPHKIGEFDTDIFIGFGVDGVSLYRGLGAQQSRASVTCWPLVVFVYSFDPQTRTRTENTFMLGVIPGPKQPKHFNSFITPFHKECRKGAIGVPTYHSAEQRLFNLHWYLLHSQVDILAAVKARCCKGPGAINPCHECRIKAIYDPNAARKTYYLPHQRPDDEEPRTEYLLSNLKTHADFVKIWDELAQAKDNKEYEELTKKHGVTGIPLLGLLPSIDMVKSFPYGLMHQLFANAVPNLVLHWKGDFKKLDPVEDVYALSQAAWEAIGSATAASARTTPSWMIRLMPDIFLNSHKYTCESWAFWIVWIAPLLLKGRLPEEHYQHLLLFSKIIKVATSLEITTQQLDELDLDIRVWHAEYERLYYRYEYSRLSACPLTIHALIHIPNDTRNAGPLSRIWEFSTERIMGLIARSVTNKQYPFSQLSKNVKKMEQIKLTAMKYGVEDELNLRRPRRDWSRLGAQEQMMHHINDTTVLKSPRDDAFAWEKSHRRRTAVYFKQALGLQASAHALSLLLPETIVRWGKHRVMGERDVVRNAFGARNYSADKIRDSSYVRVELLVDQNAHDRNLPDDPQPEIRYAQLLYVFHVTLPQDEDCQVMEDCEALLGMIRWCKDAIGDAAHTPLWYETEGELQVVNIATIQCGVARVKCGTKWGIIDNSFGCARMVFNDGEANTDEDE